MPVSLNQILNIEAALGIILINDFEDLKTIATHLHLEWCQWRLSPLVSLLSSGRQSAPCGSKEGAGVLGPWGTFPQSSNWKLFLTRHGPAPGYTGQGRSGGMG